MTLLGKRANAACFFFCLTFCGFSQEPAGEISTGVLKASKQDPGAVDRGGKVYTSYCAGCHGVGARGGAGAPDLIRSVLVLDDEKGNLIGPVVREGRPDKGMPKLGLNEAQIADVIAWLHVKTYAAGHRVLYEFKDVLTGNPNQGELYFQAHCGRCHSPQKDLAGIGKKYDPLSLQTRWLRPETPRSHEKQVTVTTKTGETASGTLEYIDDFHVSLRDSEGRFHSFTLGAAWPKVSVKNILQAHVDLLGQYKDADIHNVTAYLVTLK